MKMKDMEVIPHPQQHNCAGWTWKLHSQPTHMFRFNPSTSSKRNCQMQQEVSTKSHKARDGSKLDAETDRFIVGWRLCNGAKTEEERCGIHTLAMAMALAPLCKASVHRIIAALLRQQGRGEVREVGSRCGFSSELAVHIKALWQKTGASFTDGKAAPQQCGWDAGNAFFFSAQIFWEEFLLWKLCWVLVERLLDDLE